MLLRRIICHSNKIFKKTYTNKDLTIKDKQKKNNSLYFSLLEIKMKFHFYFFFRMS